MSNKPWLKYRRSTSYEVSFPSLPSLQGKPSEIDLYQECHNHDILELTFFRNSSSWTNLLKAGTPVVFTWRQGGEKNVWTGYVNHVSSQSASQQERKLKVVCVGASYRLKARGARTWKNKTVTEVAKEIAKEFRLSFVGEPSTRRFEQLSMSGQTYWNFLQEYAAKIGYGFYAENTTLYLRPIHKLLNDSISNAPVMGLEIPSPAANVKAFDRTLDSFILEKGDYFDGVENPYTTKVTSGINPLTSKQIFSKVSPKETSTSSTRRQVSPTIFEDRSKEVVHSSSFSKKAAKDIAFGARFNVIAQLRGQGDPRIRPYRGVYVLNTGTNTDGFWTVKRAHHLFNITGLYEVSLEIATDGIGPNANKTFRGTQPPRGSTIDVEALLTDSLRGNSRTEKRTRLISRSLPIKEVDQGFEGITALWSGD